MTIGSTDVRSVPDMKTNREWKERHIYFFKCSGCGRDRAVSFKRKRAKGKLCRSCRVGPKVDPNQLPLFEQPKSEATQTI